MTVHVCSALSSKPPVNFHINGFRQNNLYRNRSRFTVLRLRQDRSAVDFTKTFLPRNSATLLKTSKRPINSKRNVHLGVIALRGRELDELLKGCDPDNVKLAARVLEQGITAAERWSSTCTGFLTPPEMADCTRALSRVADVSFVEWGGYPQAERKRLALCRTETVSLDETPDEYLALLSIEGNFMFDPAAHGDFMGAILNTGIERHTLGDILVQGETGAQVITKPEMVPHLQATLMTVRSVPVTVHHVPLSDLKMRPPRVDEMRSVEASLRIDAVASAGFRMPRSKCVSAIASGDVRINWKSTGVKPSKIVQTGDVISIRGKGRLEIGDISKTNKGRYAVEMVRFI